jgi:hypothetical protein
MPEIAFRKIVAVNERTAPPFVRAKNGHEAPISPPPVQACIAVRGLQWLGLHADQAPEAHSGGSVRVDGSNSIDTADKPARFVSQQTPNLSLRKEALYGLPR